MRPWTGAGLIALVVAMSVAVTVPVWFASRHDLDEAFAELRAQGMAPTWPDAQVEPRDEEHVALVAAVVTAAGQVEPPEASVTAAVMAAWAAEQAAQVGALRQAIDALPEPARLGGPRLMMDTMPWTSLGEATKDLGAAARVAVNADADLARMVRMAAWLPDTSFIELLVAEQVRMHVLGAIAAAHRDRRTAESWTAIVRAWAGRPRRIGEAAQTELRILADLYDPDSRTWATLRPFQDDLTMRMVVRGGRADLIRHMGMVARELEGDPARMGAGTAALWARCHSGGSGWWMALTAPDLVLMRIHAPAIELIQDRETQSRLFAACVAAALDGQPLPADPQRADGGPVRSLSIEGVQAGWYGVGRDGRDDGGSGDDWRMPVPPPLR
jgi:hypothetical protein